MQTKLELRRLIDEIDNELVHKLGLRVKYSSEIAEIKKQENLPIIDPKRERIVVERWKSSAKNFNKNEGDFLDTEIISDIVISVMQLSVLNELNIWAKMEDIDVSTASKIYKLITKKLYCTGQLDVEWIKEQMNQYNLEGHDLDRLLIFLSETGVIDD